MEIKETTQSRNEAHEMAKNLTARYRQPLRVVYFPKAIPKRYAVVDDQTFADEYAGQDWAVLVLTTVAG